MRSRIDFLGKSGHRIVTDLNLNFNVTMDTLLQVFTALKAKVKLQVELPNLKISIGE
ncbi:hypothetical protein [Dyadobacter alkalitolerans]|uniref:hypothetical protein n=1 Tax=Dyadobacter alkalitolerans TaxID=492736 RepID=UPI001E4701D0|nr:hypothetical protein [Dyadobacter alkalitolerans]